MKMMRRSVPYKPITLMVEQINQAVRERTTRRKTEPCSRVGGVRASSLRLETLMEHQTTPKYKK